MVLKTFLMNETGTSSWNKSDMLLTKIREGFLIFLGSLRIGESMIY